MMATIGEQVAFLRKYIDKYDTAIDGISNDVLEAVLHGYTIMSIALRQLTIKTTCHCPCCRATEEYAGTTLLQLDAQSPDKAR